jgi:hypothetical protein
MVDEVGRSIALDRPTSFDPMPNFRPHSVIYPSEAPGKDCPLNRIVVHPTTLPYCMLGLCNVSGVTKGETSSTSRAIVYIDPHHADVMRSEKTEKLIDYVVNWRVSEG